MKKVWIFGMIITMFSCKTDKQNKDILQGQIVGLKKGTVYLNRVENDTLIAVDSVSVKGDDSFTFDLTPYEPQLMAVTLKEDTDREYILMFTDDTVNLLKTSLRKYGVEKVLSGGENFRKWQEYKQILRQYNDKKLDLIKEEVEAVRQKDSQLHNQVKEQLFSLEKRRIKYALNFSISNKHLPVGAYVALKELTSSRRLLDTVYKSLNPDIRQSLYGQKIKRLLNEKD